AVVLIDSDDLAHLISESVLIPATNVSKLACAPSAGLEFSFRNPSLTVYPSVSALFVRLRSMSTDSNVSALQVEPRLVAAERSAFKILLAVSVCHLLNDTVQSLLPALYPLLRGTFHLDFGQVGLIAFTATFTSSLLQPLVGLYSDRHP